MCECITFTCLTRKTQLPNLYQFFIPFPQQNKISLEALASRFNFQAFSWTQFHAFNLVTGRNSFSSLLQ